MKIFILVLFFPFLGLSQNNSDVTPYLPKNSKMGDCYEMFFDYDKKVEWIKVHCDSIPGMKLPIGMRYRLKIGYTETIEYQTKLISLGYDLALNGIFDKKTADAHHKYLKVKKGAKKKAESKRKKELKDSIKQVKLQNKRSQKVL